MQLKFLWDLQQLDLAILAVKQKIEEAPALSGVEEAAQELAELEKVLTEQKSKLKEDHKTLKSLEMHNQKIVDDRKELHESMYDGTVTSNKELEQMMRKMDLLAEERKKTEDDLLLLMESIETQESQLEQTTEDLNKCGQDLQSKETSLADDLQKLNSELASLEEKRAKQVEKVETKYLNKYNMLAEKNQGQALAMVGEDICGGCRVFISSGLRGHLYNPEAMVYCENCGRLLVKLDD